jgi:GNAT superfamily N-acetyltransferase
MSGLDPFEPGAVIGELEANLWETWSHFGCGPGCALHNDGDALWFETPLPTLPYNGVLKFQAEQDVDRRIDQLVDHFAGRGVAFMWIVHPTASPPDLPHRLQQRGLQDIELMPGMARGLADLPEPPPPPDGITVRKMMDEHDAQAFFQFATWRWGVPPTYQAQYEAVVADFHFGQPGSQAHMWQAWRAGRPIAKAGLFLATGSAGVYAVATRPEARRLGLASLLTLTALDYARRNGHTLAVLCSTPMAESLYRSLGFETRAEFRLFASVETHI